MIIMDIRHLRYRNFDRVRHSKRLTSWLSTQAARLGNTMSAIFDALRTFSSTEIEDTAALTNTAVPVITGTAQVGQVLNTTDGTWSEAGSTISYQWKSGGADVGTDVNNYTPVAEDVGNTITVTVTATNGISKASADSAATAAVIA